MKNVFYIVEQDDPDKFPLIGTENFDGFGNPLMSEEDFEMFGHNLMHLLQLRCPKRKFALLWDTVQGFDISNFPGFGETDVKP